MRAEMQPPAQRIRYGLSFVVVIKAGEIAPARIPAQFDQTGAEHDAKNQPAVQPNHGTGWRLLWKRPAIDQGTEENGQKAGFQQLNLPTITVPVLSHMD